MKKIARAIQAGVMIAGITGLAGCGGGGGGGAVTTQSDSVTVSPSLGKFSDGAHVTIRKPDGTQLGKADIAGGTGTATVPIGSYSGPILIEVTGDASGNVKYYDEGSGTERVFGAADKLSAIAPAVQANVGVTTATNAAVAQLLRSHNGAIPAAISTADINLANVKIATALGIDDVLQAPKLIDLANHDKNALNTANVEDRYALKLAAMAKVANGSGGKTALDLAKNLADDLADGTLDGKDGATDIAGVAYDHAFFEEQMQARSKEMAAQMADATSRASIDNDPTVLGRMQRDVSALVTVNNASDVQKAKAMFQELRGTLNSFANGNTGFLDTQARRAADDLKAVVAPALEKTASRVTAVGTAIAAFEDARAYSVSGANGLASGVFTPGAAATLGRQYGSVNAAWYGYGAFDLCWTDLATGVASKVTCAHAGPGSADYANNRLKMVVFELSATGVNQYSYTATRRNLPVTFAPNGFDVLADIQNLGPAVPGLPVGTGTVAATVVNGQLNAFAFSGTLTPSANACATSVTVANCPADKVDVHVARTALAAANTDRYALSGSVSTVDAAGATLASVGFDDGSYVDLDQSVSGGGMPVALNLLGTAKTAASKFSGSLLVDGFQTDANGLHGIPTRIVFAGDVSDTSTGGAGKFLTGKLELGVADYKLYDASLPDSASNFIKLNVSFTGTVQAPSRPQLKLVLAASRTGPDSGTTTLNYSYGAVSITGSGPFDRNGVTSMTLSNQDGIQLTLTPGQMEVKKSGASLATVSGKMIHYVDGVSESLM